MEKKGGIIAIAGIALAALGGALRLTSLGLVGLGVVGVGIICWGMSGMLEGRMSFFHPGVRYSETYYGLAGRAWGILILLSGVGLVGFSILLLFQPDLSFEEAATHPLAKSGAMFFGGIIGVLYAITLILGRAEDDDESRLRRIVRLPIRLFGVLLLLVSAGLAVTGVVRIAAPHIYEDALRSIS
ncbi:MAG: hypothetical protein H0U54_04340 [Acidobacteria bacterium]|nr:hypothetical protein [Acidobacteriota bacterium]